MTDQGNTGARTIRMFGADWCGDCRRTKAQLTDLDIDFEYLEVDKNEDAQIRAIEISGVGSIPVVLFPDETFLVEPSHTDMEWKLRELGIIT